MNDMTDLEKQELEDLKVEADKLGLKYHHRVGIKKLKGQLSAFKRKQTLDARKEEQEIDVNVNSIEKESITPTETVAKKEKKPNKNFNTKPVSPEAAKFLKSVENLGSTIKRPNESTPQFKARLRRQAAKKIRIRAINLNPAKKNWNSEIYTVSNKIVGTFKETVPFNLEQPWHVSYIIYKQLVEKKFQSFYTITGPRGEKIRKGKMVKEFNIEVLPPLTKQELKDLEVQQAMNHSIDQ